MTRILLGFIGSILICSVLVGVCLYCLGAPMWASVGIALLYSGLYSINMRITEIQERLK